MNMRRRLLLLAVPALALAVGSWDVPRSLAEPEWYSGLLRVCADPNNMPYSDRAGEGFENKLAELVAKAMGRRLVYTWWPQRRGFISHALDRNRCDVLMGVPQMDTVATTRPYYRSTYVFVTRKDRNLTFSSMKAPELRKLSIGVAMIGNDGWNTPPAHALAEERIVDNVKGYMVYGDYSQKDPPARLIRAVEDGEIDIAAAWGPLAGYFAKVSPVPLRVVPITDTISFLPLSFTYSISMGVRKYDAALQEELNEVIIRKRDEIRKLLDSYGVPQV